MRAAPARDVEAEADRVANVLAAGMTTSVDRKVLRALLLKTDGWMLCQGRMADIKSKHQKTAVRKGRGTSYRYLALTQFVAELRRVSRARWSAHGDNVTMSVGDVIRIARTIAARSRRQP